VTCPKRQRAGFELAALDVGAAPECPPGSAPRLAASRVTCRQTASERRGLRQRNASRGFCGPRVFLVVGPRWGIAGDLIDSHGVQAVPTRTLIGYCPRPPSITSSLRRPRATCRRGRLSALRAWVVGDASAADVAVDGSRSRPRPQLVGSGICDIVMCVRGLPARVRPGSVRRQSVRALRVHR
jgi:hypothetical protein